jgi:arylsulfatase
MSFDYFFRTPTRNDGFVGLYHSEGRIEEKAPMKTLTKRYTDEAIGFIRKHKADPFFVCVLVGEARPESSYPPA